MIVMNLGGILSGLSAEDLAKIPVDALDFDAMNRVGFYGDWSSVEKVRNLYLELTSTAALKLCHIILCGKLLSD